MCQEETCEAEESGMGYKHSLPLGSTVCPQGVAGQGSFQEEVPHLGRAVRESYCPSPGTVFKRREGPLWVLCSQEEWCSFLRALWFLNSRLQLFSPLGVCATKGSLLQILQRQLKDAKRKRLQGVVSLAPFG